MIAFSKTNGSKLLVASMVLVLAMCAIAIAVPSAEAATEISGDDLLEMADEDGVITLDQDYDLTSAIEIADEKITIDLNGHSMSGSVVTSDKETGYNGVIYIGEGAELTIIGEGAVTFATDDSNNRGIVNYGTIAIGGGDFVSEDSYLLRNYGTATITGGSFTSIATSCIYNDTDAEMTVTDAELSVEMESSNSIGARCIYNLGKITVTDTVFTMTNGAGGIENGGTATVTGCTFTKEGTAAEGTTYMAMAIAASNSGVIDVYDCTVNSEVYGFYVFDSGGTINVHSGTYDAKTIFRTDLLTTSYPNGAATINVYGGEFNGAMYVSNSNCTINIDDDADVVLEGDSTINGTVTGEVDNTDGSITLGSNAAVTDMTVNGGEVIVNSTNVNLPVMSSAILSGNAYNYGDLMAYTYVNANGDAITYGIPTVSYTGRDYAGSSVSVYIIQVLIGGVPTQWENYTTMTGHNIIYQNRADAILMNLECGTVRDAGICYVYVGFSFSANRNITVEEVIEFPILQANIDSATIAGVEGSSDPLPNKTYTGDEIELVYGEDYLIYDVDGDVLDVEFGTDFVLRYEDNIKVGTATVEVVWIGNYTTDEDVINTFDIVSDIENVTAAYQDEEGNAVEIHLGQVIDNTCITTTGHYNDGTEAPVTIDDTNDIVDALEAAGIIDGEGVFIVSGDIEVEVTVTIDNAEYDCVFSAYVVPVKEIQVSGDYLYEYEHGEELNTENMFITVSYEDGCYAVFHDDGDGFELYIAAAADLRNYQSTDNVGTVESGGNYMFTGDIYIAGYGVTVVYAPNDLTDDEDEDAVDYTPLMNDFARYMGALYRGSDDIASVTFQGVTYTWDTNDTLAGSNWVDKRGNTLVSAVVDYVEDDLIDGATSVSIEMTVAYGSGYSYTLTYGVVITSDEYVPEEDKALTTGFMQSPDDYIRFDPNVFNNVAGEVTVDVTFVNGDVTGDLLVFVKGGIAYYVYYDADGVLRIYETYAGADGDSVDVLGFVEGLIPEVYGPFTGWLVYSGNPCSDDILDISGLDCTGIVFHAGESFQINADSNMWLDGAITLLAQFETSDGGDEPVGPSTHDDAYYIVNAILYVYDDYPYVGTVSVSGTAISVSYSEGYDLVDVMNDFARYMGALYRVSDGAIGSVTFDGITYTWQSYTDENGEESWLSGSNWRDASGNTLVSAVVDYVEANLSMDDTSGTIDLTVNGSTRMTYSVSLPATEAPEPDPEDPTVTRIIVDAQTEYTVGEEFSAVVYAINSDGSVDVLSEDEYDVTGFSSEAVGTYDVTISYEGVDSVIVTVTVSAADTSEPEPGTPDYAEFVAVSIKRLDNYIVISLASVPSGGVIPSGTITLNYTYMELNPLGIYDTITGSIEIPITEGTTSVTVSPEACTMTDFTMVIALSATFSVGDVDYESDPITYTVALTTNRS